MRTLGLLITLVAIFSLAPATLSAQVELDETGATLSFSPQYPRPQERLVVKALSSSVDIKSSDILWEVDGKAIEDGIGVDTIEVTAPEAGRVMQIRATILYNNRRVVAESSFSPAGVSLLWEGLGYTPPFYKGRTLVSYGGITHFVAIPDFRNTSLGKVSPDRLIYTWQKNGRNIPSVSGIGKSTADLLQDSYLRGDETVTVDVRDPETNALAQSSVSISPQKNPIVIYEETPSLGRLYNKAISGTTELFKSEMTLIAEPYFMTLASRDGSDALYLWKQDGFDVPSARSKRITIQNALEGKALLSVSVSKSSLLLQGGLAGVSVAFQSISDALSGSNLFSE